MSKRTVIGEAVKAIREAKAVSDPNFRGSVFAITCLMSHAHLSNIEAGRRTHPSAEVIERIALHLGVSIDAISYACPDCIRQSEKEAA